MDIEAFQNGAEEGSSSIPLPSEPEAPVEPIMTLQAPEDVTVVYNVPEGSSPSNTQHASLDTVIFSIETTGENNTYLWQYWDATAAGNAGGLFVDVGDNSPILEIRLSEYQYPQPLGSYRVVVTNEASGSQLTESVELIDGGVYYAESAPSQGGQQNEQDNQLFYEELYCRNGHDRNSSTINCRIP